ncbi:MAG: hypothetical protein SGILL_006398 [Bacillariaceae sp.]
MIEQRQHQQSDRYSVVVLDYPKREQQDIECYCIPSSNLDDHGYVPAAHHDVGGDQRDDVGTSQSRPNFLLSSKQQQLQQSTSKRGGWGRLWKNNKSLRNLGKKPLSSRRLLKSKSTTPRAKKQLTEKEMMRYISSQDDLDWSAADDNAPANPNMNRQQPLTSIVEPLVQIYLEDRKSGGEHDDSTLVSAMSQDTCWKDESQGVVELVLPNVLFCDDREDENDETNDVDNWNILFPSYIEEARENSSSRQQRDSASKSGREGVEKNKGTSERDDASGREETSEDEASISSTGWEDDESESESEKDEENAAKPSTPKHEESEDTNPLLTTVSPLSETHPAEKVVEEEVVEVQLQASPEPPPELFLPSLAPKQPGETTSESSPVREDTPIDTTANTGLFSGLWRRVTQIPALLTRRKGNGRLEESSTAGGSAAANDGENDKEASWRSNSLGSLGGWSAFEDCKEEEGSVEEESSRWWELNTSLIDEVTCGSLPSPAAVTDTASKSPREETTSPLSDGGSCSSASAAVFEDAAEDEVDGASVSPKPMTKVEEPKSVEDDPWSAAKRGDVDGVRKWTNDKTYDWSQKDVFGNTALFYACHSGAAINISIVKILLDEWPVEEIPADVLDRCKTNALNKAVVKMLNNPEKAEAIISSVFRDYLASNDEMTDDDDESYHLTKWLLYDLDEGSEEGDY